jgi:hypothetical protein
MSKRVRFGVSVIGCNADTFECKYNKYITSFRDGAMDNKIFYLDAPQFIKDEISELGEEGIEVNMYW